MEIYSVDNFYPPFEQLGAGRKIWWKKLTYHLHQFYSSQKLENILASEIYTQKKVVWRIIKETRQYNVQVLWPLYHDVRVSQHGES